VKDSTAQFMPGDMMFLADLSAGHGHVFIQVVCDWLVWPRLDRFNFGICYFSGAFGQLSFHRWLMSM
jgi:hypothetical protein